MLSEHVSVARFILERPSHVQAGIAFHVDTHTRTHTHTNACMHSSDSTRVRTVVVVVAAVVVVTIIITQFIRQRSLSQLNIRSTKS